LKRLQLVTSAADIQLAIIDRVDQADGVSELVPLEGSFCSCICISIHQGEVLLRPLLLLQIRIQSGRETVSEMRQRQGIQD
jgi:hypothetical protein